jgi:hypothetical protein
MSLFEETQELPDIDEEALDLTGVLQVWNDEQTELSRQIQTKDFMLPCFLFCLRENRPERLSFAEKPLSKLATCQCTRCFMSRSASWTN